MKVLSFLAIAIIMFACVPSERFVHRLHAQKCKGRYYPESGITGQPDVASQSYDTREIALEVAEEEGYLTDTAICKVWIEVHLVTGESLTGSIVEVDTLR